MPVQDIKPEPAASLVARTPDEYDPRPPMAPRPAEPAPPILRNVLVPISLVTTFALVYWVRIPLALAVLAVSPLIALFVLAPSWAAASMRAFDRDALRLRAAGRPSELRARFDRAIGMRLFGAPSSTAERLGDVLRELGDAAGARRAYQRAIETVGATPTLPMLLGLAHAAYGAREDAEAIGAYRRVLAIDATLPRVRARLAHSLLRRGAPADAADAHELLEAARPTSDAERTELALLRAYVEARKGKTSAARTALREIEGGDASLRDEIESALSGSPTKTEKKKRR
ncbi:hypothetical protein [Sandaracinus amylolyticus]|uniref:hypothetical protein n=1 Tax=Sandaracinus amylolyticus TaxID=927083 RepID=UPI001F1F5C5C|nr:hypothetical protein [Sandaracinus amylolyticus]UJR79626.1 Hypothetical protein I5071_16640 [Sandaracinus amylolyticus]